MRLLSFLFLTLFFLNLPAQNSLLWEISGNNLKNSSYLFGTIHIKDKRVFKVNDSTLKALYASEKLITEISFEKDTINKVAHLVLAKESERLSNNLSPEEFNELKAKAKEILSTLEYLVMDQMKPIFVTAMVLDHLTEDDKKNPLDLWLIKKAKRKDLLLDQLEYAEEQFKALNQQSIPEQIEDLQKSLNNLDSCKRELNFLVNAYLNQDLLKLDSLLNKTEASEKDSLMLDVLLTKRNYVMLERSIPKIENHSCFIAVGAGHLVGEKGLIELLKQKGYTLRPILPSEKK